MKTLHLHVPGKWILAGEHSVVRGGDALVFPLSSRSLQLKAAAHGSANLEFSITSSSPELRRAAEACLQQAFQQIKAAPLKISLQLESTIPVGSGLGSSAALSVAITKMLVAWNLLKEENIFTFAHELENIFHGQSSGLDVAAVLSSAPIVFSRGLGARSLPTRWQPKFCLLDSGLRASTKQCVTQVSALQRHDLDERMQLAVQLAGFALTEQESKQGTHTLREALVLANSCFQEWGLVPPALADFMSGLQKQGLQVLKPTGSGGGGFVLCLAPTNLPENALPCA